MICRSRPGHHAGRPGAGSHREVYGRVEGLADEQVAEGLRRVDERADRIRSGEDVDALLAAQAEFAGRLGFGRHLQPRRPGVCFFGGMLGLRPGVGTAGCVVPGAGAVRRGRHPGPGATTWWFFAPHTSHLRRMITASPSSPRQPRPVRRRP